MVSLQSLVILALVFVGCYLLGKWGFKFDTSVEDRRKAAASIAAVMIRYGMVRLPQLFICYSVGDYSGLANGMIEFCKLMLQGEEVVIAEFNEVFTRVLEVKLLSPEGRAYLQTRLDAAKTAASQSPANSPITPTPAPVVVA